MLHEITGKLFVFIKSQVFTIKKVTKIYRNLNILINRTQINDLRRRYLQVIIDSKLKQCQRFESLLFMCNSHST